jgi:hypothetical protein
VTLKTLLKGRVTYLPAVHPRALCQQVTRGVGTAGDGRSRCCGAMGARASGTVVLCARRPTGRLTKASAKRVQRERQAAIWIFLLAALLLPRWSAELIAQPTACPDG